MVHFGGSWSLLFNKKVNVKTQALNVNLLLLSKSVVVMFLVFNPSRHPNHVVVSGFLKRTRPRAERADGQPLARLTPGFLPLTAMSVP